MEKTYKVALSYAHADKQIAAMLKKELENTFGNGFFMDELRPEELAAAGSFVKKLEDIFERSDYSVILYSERYKLGKFTIKELEKIMKIMKRNAEPHVFIINVNDSDLPDELGEAAYIPLKVPDSAKEEDIYKTVCDIIHNRVKKAMIWQSVEERNVQEEYSLNVQTLFMSGNTAMWRQDYDWNILGAAYIEDVGGDGRKIKDESSWEELWKFVEKDFLRVKDNLERDALRRIRFNCHLSIAYKLGQVYGDLGQASGNRNLELISSNRNGDIKFRLDAERRIDMDAMDFISCRTEEGNNKDSKDLVCIISIIAQSWQNILETVKYSLNKQGQEYRRILIFQAETMIKDSGTLESLAEYLRGKIWECVEECGLFGNFTVHLFPRTTAPLMFMLGARSIVPGEVWLYEYFGKDNSYELSLKR